MRKRIPSLRRPLYLSINYTIRPLPPPPSPPPPPPPAHFGYMGSNIPAVFGVVGFSSASSYFIDKVWTWDHHTLKKDIMKKLNDLEGLLRGPEDKKMAVEKGARQNPVSSETPVKPRTLPKMGDRPQRAVIIDRYPKQWIVPASRPASPPASRPASRPASPPASPTAASASSSKDNQ